MAEQLTLNQRALGAPEASAASGGCSEPERAGQRRRAMRARGNARCQRDTPQPDESLEAHQIKKPPNLGGFFCFVLLPPRETDRFPWGGFAVRAARSGSARRDSRPNRPSTGRSVLTASSGSAPGSRRTDDGRRGRLFCLVLLPPRETDRFPWGGFAVRAARSGSARRDSRPDRPSTGRSVLTASSGSAPGPRRLDDGRRRVAFLFGAFPMGGELLRLFRLLPSGAFFCKMEPDEPFSREDETI